MWRPAGIKPQVEETQVLKPKNSEEKAVNAVYRDTYTFPDEMSKMWVQALLNDLCRYRWADWTPRTWDKIISVIDDSTKDKQRLTITTERGWLNAARINELITKQFNSSVAIVVGLEEQLTKEFQASNF